MDLEYDDPEELIEKCGELFLTNKGNVIFHCALCEQNFKGFQDFHDHIFEKHFTPDNNGEFANESNEEVNSMDPLNIGDIYPASTEILVVSDDKATEVFEISKENEISNPLVVVPTHLTKKEPIRPKLGPGPFNPKITDRKFKCPLCDFTCGDKSNIKGHIRRHSTNKPYKCTECPKAFHTRTELNTHMRTHTGERPYLCTLCGQAFTTASKLSKHQKRHYNIRDKECPICKMRFYGKDLLRGHMAVHSDVRAHKCDKCEASFKKTESLKNHMKLHENKREYQCKLCDSRFNQNAGLYSHMKSTHTLVKTKSEINI